MAEGDGLGTVEEGQVATAAKATERLTFFSDAVVAIAITLLAIELPVPTGATTAEFLAVVHEETFEYVTFLISFVVIAAHWRIHHSLFRHVRRCDGVRCHLNMLWLLLIVLTPFFTSVLNGANDDELTFLRFARVRQRAGTSAGHDGRTDRRDRPARVVRRDRAGPADQSGVGSGH